MIYESFTTFVSKVYCFTSFVNNVQGFPQPLSHKEEAECFAKLKAGEKSARDTLVNHNLRLVAHIVKKFQNSMEADDLISVGTIGLMKAVDSFDYSKGVKFSTYASRCIENEILMLIRANKRHKDVISFNSTITGGTDKDEILLQDVIAVDDDDDIIQAAETSFMMDKVFDVMKKELSPMEQQVMIYRYGLQGKDLLTQREIAKMLGLSRSYISRIENKALEIIKKKMLEEDEEKV